MSRRSEGVGKSRGAIDVYTGNKLHGWFAAFGEAAWGNQFYLVIDKNELGPFRAREYRGDLHDKGVLEGYCGFQVSVPVRFLDNGMHEIALLDLQRETVVPEQNMRLPACPSTRYLSDTLITATKYSEFENQKIVVVAGFSESGRVLLYQKRLLTYFKEQGFFVIYSLAIATDRMVPPELSGYCDVVIVRRNIGYDFGSWAHAYHLLRNIFDRAKSVYFVNDSVIGPLASPKQEAIDLDELEYDVCGVTASHQHTFHIQSYFWRVNPKIVTSGVLDEFFFYTHPLPASKEDAITKFELNTARFFMERGFSVGVALDLPSLYHKEFSRFKEAAEEALSRYSKLILGEPYGNPIYEAAIRPIYEYYAAFLKYDHLNPSHYFFRAILDSGFPFIKKELVTKNPTGYPFPQDIARCFSNTSDQAMFEEVLRVSPTRSAYY